MSLFTSTTTRDSSTPASLPNAVNNVPRANQSQGSTGRGVNDIPIRSAPSASKDVTDFWSRLHMWVTSSKGSNKAPFDINDLIDRNLWMSCWQVAASGASGPSPDSHVSLLRCYKNAPNTAKIHPAANSVLKVMSGVVASMSKGGGGGDNSSNANKSRATLHKSGTKASQPNAADPLNTLMCVVDVVRDRLMYPESLQTLTSPDDAISDLADLRKTFLRAIMVSGLEQVQEDAFLERVAHFKDYTAAIQLVSVSFAAQVVLGGDAPLETLAEPWLGWRDHPTVGWLMSESWHRAVPELRNMYDNEVQYAETLLRVWTLLTFYWGSGAVWPRCSHRQGGAGGDDSKMCSEPLLADCSSHSHEARCSSRIHDNRTNETKVCGKAGSWRCHRHGPGHSVVCSSCLVKEQSRLAGAPGRGASTDIYDAVVDREHSRREGSVFYMSALESRKPPAIAPNWRTSYRLQSSVLVAVVKLSVSGEPLQRAHSLQWAEIVNYNLGPDQHEDQTRAQGRIAVRILSRGDCSALRSEADSPLEPGTRVALIDLRVFVPEVISVLATFANPQFAAQLKQIPFMGRLIGTSKSLPLVELGPQATIQNYVEFAILNSEIEPVRMLPQAAKLELVGAICRLPPVKSLYGTQLEAFANSLYASIHCTQGPPGTGKSYVGVCLVLALMLIRDAVRRNGSPVGPIVMLSYKNHALDEFLCDVVKFAPTGFISPGKMIRCGTVENPLLQRYSEKHSPMEQEFQHVLSNRIENQRLVRKVAAEWMQCARLVNTQLHWQSSEIENAALAMFSVNDTKSLVFSLGRALHLLSKLHGGEGGVRSASQAFQSLVGIDSDKDVSVDNCRAVVEQWLAQAEHWTQLPSVMAVSATDGTQVDVRVINWLHLWLQGLSPPPRCVFVGDHAAAKQCMRETRGGAIYCAEDHSCLSFRCGKPRPGREARFCDDHCCHAPPGVNAKGRPVYCLAENQGGGAFCLDHTCHGCLALGCSPPAMKSGPFACDAHQCSSPRCDKMKLFPHSRCEDHTCTECIATGTVTDFSQCNPQHQLCPSHKCAVRDCRHLRSVETPFCAQHTCRECEKRVDVATPDGILCVDHRCAHPLSICRLQKMDHGASTEYCAQHTCKVCTERKLEQTGPVTANAPRNCCAAHPLCQTTVTKGAQCGNLAMPSSVHCEAHKPASKPQAQSKPVVGGAASVVQQSPFAKLDGICCGVTKKGKRCTNKEKTGNVGEYFYCPDHIQQKPVARPAPAAAPLQMASANTSSNAKPSEQADLNSDSDDEDDEGYAQSSAGGVKNSWSDDGEDDDDAFEDAREDFNIAAADEIVAEVVSGSERRFKVIQCSGQVRADWRCGTKSVVDVDCPFWMCVVHSDAFQNRDLPVEEVVLCVEIAPKLDPVAEIPAPVKERRVKAAKVSLAGAVKAEDHAVEEDYDILHDLHGEGQDVDVTLEPDERDVEAVGPLEGGDLPAVEADFGGEYDGVEDPINDEQLRRREIGASDSGDEGEEDEDSLSGEDSDGEDGEKQDCSEETARGLATAFNWNSSTHDRLNLAAKLLCTMSFIATKLRATAEDHVMAARREKAEASSAALKNANVVGATVVGASRRLEAIRAAEPFAVVVEEACEVMEPVLVSVLAVSSLRKLELVGDHRQLPAFIQQCWFNLESALPSIKTSLFERLISGAVASHRNRRNQRGRGEAVAEQLSCTVLDEQRRMRSSIADITRPDYDDIITVTDHPQTALQCIGDALVNSGMPSTLVQHRSLWTSKGRHVPGLRSNIFFWSLKDHKESRPQAGLSACNEMEANAITELTKYLMLNGVPSGSISIITPYKGQKNLIVKTLRKEHCIPGFNRDGKPPPAGSSIVVSTVDRYQGDENDIVILSLVRSRPGNKFVALLNRFIVAVSRARLGFYIVGSVEAVTKSAHGGEGPAHWNRFITSLAQPPVDEKEINDFDGSRVGAKLPICCSRHLNEKTFCEVAAPKDFPKADKDGTWKNFCDEGCTHKMSCGHICGLTCHSPTLVPHLTQCAEEVVRPCEKHATIKLLCATVKKGVGEKVESALTRFNCEMQVSHQREECDHSERVECHLHDKLVAGVSRLPPCCKIVGDFVAACSHVIKAPKCHVKQLYALNPPKCEVVVDHRRPCGCVKTMVCDQASTEKLRPMDCKTDKTEPRPRCGHRMSAKCHDFAQLTAKWSAQTGMKVDIVPGRRVVSVEHGVEYGPSERLLMPSLRLKECTVDVNYVAECGHTLTGIACDKAFQYASGACAAPRCLSLLPVNCPLCLNCELQVPCWAVEQISEWLPWSGVDIQLLPRAMVDGRVAFFEQGLLDCRAAMPTAEVWQIINNLCTNKASIVRSCNEHHVVEYRCCQLLSVAVHEKFLPKCKTKVDRGLICGHTAKVECHAKAQEPAPLCVATTVEKFTYPCNKHSVEPRLCVELQKLRSALDIKCPVDVSCELFRCGHNVSVPCHLEADVTARTAGARPTNSLVVHDVDYCNSPAAAPVCCQSVSFQMACGHVLRNVRCTDAFAWAADSTKVPRCAELVEIASPVCGHLIQTQCWVSVALEAWDPWDPWETLGGVPQFEVESHLGEHNETVQTVVLRAGGQRPSPLPPGLKPNCITCLQPAMLVRDCGHTVHTTCSHAFMAPPVPCQEVEMIHCGCCGFESEMKCHQSRAQKLSNAPLACPNVMVKECGVCKINEVSVPCSQSNVECRSQVWVPLDCGHLSNWVCGMHADPRTSGELCRGCVVPEWDACIESEPTQAELNAFCKNSVDGAKACVPELYERVNERLVRLDLGAHQEARVKMHKIQRDLMVNDQSSPVVAAPGQFGSDFAENYNFVFVSVRDLQGPNVRNPVVSLNNKNLMQIVQTYFWQPQDTPYGRGVTVTPLTAENLRRVPLNENGTVSVCICAAHFNKELSGVAPFDTTNNSKGRQRANRTASQYMWSGFSCVNAKRQNGLDQQIYWTPNAVVPLLLLELKMPEICTVCAEPFTKTEGFCCGNGHFMCWAECFDKYVTSASEAGAIQGYCNAAGDLLCPDPRCKVPYNLQKVAHAGGPPHVFKALMDLQFNVRSAKEVNNALETQKLQLTAEFERIQAMTNLDERAAHMLRREIIDDVLTLACPRCKTAFVDFEGCFALHCGKNQCGAAFCAWCLADCGRDAHAHVLACPENVGRSYYGTKAQFEAHHCQRRAKKVRQMIARQPGEVQRFAKHILQKDVEELGIKL
eukprot:gene22513-28642_t